MSVNIQQSHQGRTGKNSVYICQNTDQLANCGLNAAELDYAAETHKNNQDVVVINRFNEVVFIVLVKMEVAEHRRLEQCRKAGFSLCGEANKLKLDSLDFITMEGLHIETLATIEGLALSNYQFLKYRKDAGDKQNSLKNINIQSESVTPEAINRLVILIDAVCFARDLVNEPVNKLNANLLAEIISNKARMAGAKAEVFNKNKIEALKMGGLLSVNLGSIDPPTFTILEWKPANAINKKPVVLAGKGIVYDTGGLSLKPTKSMDTMKCDMAGSAAVSAALCAVATAKLPVHLMALIPATDNRPGGNAYVPGDVITMFDGTTVEVLNTDAEGRLILADALAYAKKFDPELVIDFATLTGSAVAAIGSQGAVAMEAKASEAFIKLQKHGEQVCERLVQFPFWDEYRDMLKSEIADLKNIGGPEAGAITAGKFLEHFTDYPYIHVDIAGPAYLERRDNYRGLGGTGFGVRLLFDYFSKML
jgi:leucyl aminopeptidase